jgi:hypothetical protein
MVHALVLVCNPPRQQQSSQSFFSLVLQALNHNEK